QAEEVITQGQGRYRSRFHDTTARIDCGGTGTSGAPIRRALHGPRPKAGPKNPPSAIQFYNLPFPFFTFHFRAPPTVPAEPPATALSIAILRLHYVAARVSCTISSVLRSASGGG